MAQNRNGSILAADFGSVTTRVNLIDIVDGVYRLVARATTGTTAGYPVDDVGVGLQRVLEELSELTGRTFYSPEGTLISPETRDRAGVDVFVTTASAGRPLRAIIVGLVPELSVTSALRALANTYIEPVAALHLRDDRSEEERLNALLTSQADLIIITGGTDDGATQPVLELLRVVQLALQVMDRGRRPNVLYAGNQVLVPQVRERLRDLTQIFIADNVRPRLDAETIDETLAVLGRAYDAFKEAHGAGFNALGAVSASGILPTAQSYARIVGYYARARGQNVMAVDVGSSTSLLSLGTSERAQTFIETDLGLGHSATNLLETVTTEAVRQWLPFGALSLELRNYALNKMLRPASIPATRRDFFIEMAFLRQAVRQMITHLPPRSPAPGLILAGGAAFTQSGNPAQDLMMVVDAVQPTGIVEVKADPHGLIPALGALAPISPEATVQLLDRDSLEHLGTVISIDGQPETGRQALALRITTEDGEVFNHNIEGGHLWQLPLPANVSLAVEMTCSRGLTILGRRRLKRTFKGGSAGLLFDVRGRPLATGSTLQERAHLLTMWLAEATGTEPQTVPERWLEPVEDEPEKNEVGESEEGRRRLGLRRRNDQKSAKNAKKKAAKKEAPDDAGDEDYDDLFGRDAEEQEELTPEERQRRQKARQLDDDLDALRDLV